MTCQNKRSDIIKQPFLIHNHDETSNFRLLDSTNKTTDILDKAFELGLPGICITNHETVSSHIKIFQHLEKHKDRFKDFKIGYGNEIYLIDEEDSIRARENNERIRYYHFILVAKNENGYKGIRELSSQAWNNSYFHRGMQRVPLFKHQLEDIMKKYKGDIIASSACIGGEIPQLLLKSNNLHEPIINIEELIEQGKIEEAELQIKNLLKNDRVRDLGKNLEILKNKLNYTQEEVTDYKNKLDYFLYWLEGIFEDDLYFELLPSDRRIQRVVNDLLYNKAKHYNIKPIITTDAHYLDISKQPLHQAYLNAKDGDREVADFYSTTYLMGRKELLDFFDGKTLNELIDNTHEIMGKISEIKFGRDTQIPKAHIPDSFDKEYIDFFKSYPRYKHIQKLLQSTNEQDQYYLHLVHKGYTGKSKRINQNWSIQQVLNRIDLEVEQLNELSDFFKQPMSGYFLFVKELVDVIWEVSFVAPNRGSAACWITNYLLDITQLNPLDYELPYWRFLHIARGRELPDIDLDLQSDMRDKVIEAIRKEYGEDRVLQLSTYTTEGVSSSILTACNGLGIDNILAQNISNLADKDLSLRKQIFGDKKDNIKPNKRLVDAIKKHENLLDNILEIEGIIKGRGSHAGGIVVFNNGYLEEGNALMKTTSGTDVTQFDSRDTEFLGGMKIDLLSTDALTRLRITMDLLLEHGKIQWQRSLRETYNKYLHPDILDYTSGKMYDMLFNGEVISAFQFSTNVGNEALKKVNARNFNDLSIANSLMRLSLKDSEQPIDKYIRFRDDISQWYREMDENNLSEREKEILKEELGSSFGICDTQESLMRLLIHEEISQYPLQRANKFRKMATKSRVDKLREEEYPYFKEKVLKNNHSQDFVDYVWDYCFRQQMQYSFAEPHIVGYTLITLQQMNLCYKFTPLYWQNACLIVDSGGNDGGGNNDYGRISRAASSLHGKVMPPDINESGLNFTPLPRRDKILFGLNPISGLRKDILESIIEYRPFNSIEDFMDKTGATVNQTEILIKAGAFNEIYKKSPRDIMVDFVDKIAVSERDSLNMTNFLDVYTNELIDTEKYKDKYLLYMFRGAARLKNNSNPNFNKHFLENLSFIAHDYDDNGNIVPDMKEFERYYDKEMDVIRDLLKRSDVIDAYNQLKKREYWIENCLGSIESWQMETISFYPNRHEFDYIPVNKHFPISNFSQMTEKGVIAGTVIDKDKPKSLIYISTKDSVVTVKMWRNVFNKYDEVITNGKKGKDRVIYDDTWFKRGTRLVLVGRKQGEQFFLDSRGTNYRQSIFLIEDFNEEQLNIRNERIGR